MHVPILWWPFLKKYVSYKFNYVLSFFKSLFCLFNHIPLTRIVKRASIEHALVYLWARFSIYFKEMALPLTGKNSLYFNWRFSKQKYWCWKIFQPEKLQEATNFDYYLSNFQSRIRSRNSLVQRIWIYTRKVSIINFTK